VLEIDVGGVDAGAVRAAEQRQLDTRAGVPVRVKTNFGGDGPREEGLEGLTARRRASFGGAEQLRRQLDSGGAGAPLGLRAIAGAARIRA